ncbi:MAG: hypothetical protein ACLUVS_07660, partial [Oscillospiraceae bacterium]
PMGITDSHGQLVNRPWESCIQRRYRGAGAMRLSRGHRQGGQVSAVTIRQHRLAQTPSSPSAWTLPPIRPPVGR